MFFIYPILSVLALIGIDQLSKYLAVKYIMNGGEIKLIDGLFSLAYVENRGAAFGILQDGRWFFIILTTII